MSFPCFGDALGEHVSQHAAFICLALDQAGIIVDANAYAQNLMGEVKGKRLADILVDFDGTFRLELALDSRETPVLLNIPLRTGLPETYYFRFIEAGDSILVIGEVNSAEVEELRASLLDTNNRINALVRELQKKNAELARAQAELARLASTDGLTGLANRRLFDETLSREHARHKRSGARLSLIMLDIDHFKTYNDTYGHVCGDRCLQQVARAIGGGVRRATDLAARYGGEEFACILPETAQEGAMRIAETIRRAVEALDIPHRASHTASHVTVSIGVVTVACERQASVADVIVLADGQLYAAKTGGRNRVCAAGNTVSLPESEQAAPQEDEP